jgi:hypothetical protein
MGHVTVLVHGKGGRDRLSRIQNGYHSHYGSFRSFQAEPLAAPIVVLGREKAKLAFESFRLIRMYTGPGGTIRKQVLPIAKKLVTLCIHSPQIREEVLFQLLKQLRKDRNDAYRLKTWDLSMVVATTIPSSRDSEGEIKSHIARHTNSKNGLSLNLRSSPLSDSPQDVQLESQCIRSPFRCCPQIFPRIVFIEITQFLCTVFETRKNYIKFLVELSDRHQYTLQFLCGFLRQMTQSEAVTRIGLSNLAIIVGSVIVAM